MALIYRIFFLVCCVFLILAGFQRFFENFCYFSTFWNYKYEWDWTDGDVYGQVDRLRTDLPLYMDLSQGLAYTSYPPLDPYLIQCVDSLLGENTPQHARQINFVLLIATVFLFYLTFIYKIRLQFI